MWYKKFENENGFYQDENGTRYTVDECHRVTAPDGRINAELGYTEFNNMEECLSAWQLSKVSETDTPTTFSLRQSVEPIIINDIDEPSFTKLLKKFNIKSFADIRNKFLAKLRKS